jgi:hypothetical protein
MSTASASAATSAKAATRTAVITHHSDHGIRKRPDGAPAGCNSGNYCSYNQGNGGDLCFQTHINQNWPNGCANQNDSGYNRNGNAIDLFWGFDQSGAWYTLYSGHYLLYMTQNYFNNCSTCGGYGQQLGYNVSSSAFK